MDALQAYNPWLSYWNATPKIYDAWTHGKGPPAGLMTQWVGGLAHGSVYGLASASFDQLPAPAYTPKLDLGPNVYHVTAATMGNYGLAIGSDIAPFAYIVVPIAYDGSGHPTEFAQYSITTCDPSLASTTLGSAPKPADVVAAAKRFASDPSLSNVEAPNDCQNIAQDVSSAAGAALADPTGSDTPSDNQSGGYWRIVYRGSDPGAIQNWSSLVKRAILYAWAGMAEAATPRPSSP
jgi:hypothetical protein